MRFYGEIDYTLKDIRQFARLHKKLRNRILRIIANVLTALACLVLIALGVLLIAWQAFTARLAVYYASLLFLFVLLIVLREVNLRIQWKTFQTQGTICFETDDRAVIEKTNELKSEYVYTAFCDVVHYRDCFYLYINKRQAVILPERCFVEGDPAAFGAFLEQKTGLKLKEIK